jgi:hypothetical protein
MPSKGFESTITEDKRRQTDALDNAATGIGNERIFLVPIALRPKDGQDRLIIEV